MASLLYGQNFFMDCRAARWRLAMTRIGISVLRLLLHSLIFLPRLVDHVGVGGFDLIKATGLQLVEKFRLDLVFLAQDRQRLVSQLRVGTFVGEAVVIRCDKFLRGKRVVQHFLVVKVHIISLSQPK